VNSQHARRKVMNKEDCAGKQVKGTRATDDIRMLLV